ncbi:MAG: lytic transglycosylase domain-containing protein [Deltaproteobacteria bacterium]|jgi:soluble lytic murein transglycosylase-like protein|nr:lytic transglycosylase domain-containing protein [Deltaproteobacteria bacterium]
MPSNKKALPKVFAFLALALLALMGGQAAMAGGEVPGNQPLSPVTEECLRDSAERFGLPVSLIALVMAVESGQVGEVSRNRNGTFDMGPMQINSSWLPLLKGVGVGERAITDNGCVNLAVGAWILRGHLRSAKSLEKAISDYHSLNPKLGAKYLRAAKARARGLDLGKAISQANGSLAVPGDGGAKAAGTDTGATKEPKRRKGQL